MKIKSILNPLLKSFFGELAMRSPSSLKEEIAVYDEFKNIFTVKHLDKNILLNFIKKNYTNWKYLCYKLCYFTLDISYKPILYQNLFTYKNISSIESSLHSDIIKLLRYHISEEQINNCLSLYFERIESPSISRLTMILYLLITNYQFKFKLQIEQCFNTIHSHTTYIDDVGRDKFYFCLNFIITNINEFNNIKLHDILDFVYIFRHYDERYTVLINALSKTYDNETELQPYLSLLELQDRQGNW